MTYLVFHLVYILPILLVLVFAQRRPLARLPPGVALRWLGIIILIAFAYTTPWDNYLIYRDVWSYPPERVLFTIGYVPIEEYAFFVLQPIMGGLFYFWLRGRGLLANPTRSMPSSFRIGLVGGLAAVAVLGVAFLFSGEPQALYAGLILAWSAPVLAGLALIGADKIWDERRRVATAIMVPTVYLWFADREAIRRGIWDIRNEFSFDIDPLGLPIEEATFFLVTMCLCIFGLVLFLPGDSKQ